MPAPDRQAGISDAAWYSAVVISHSGLVIAAAILIFGCSGGGALSPQQTAGAAASREDAAQSLPARVIELRYDETAEYLEIELRWLSLEDSRCPTGVTCVWGGQMLASVEVAHATRGTIVVELLRRAGREPEVAHAFDYELRLLDVSPHPKHGVKTDRRHFVMRVEISAP